MNRKGWKDSRGQSLVEFALIATFVLIPLVFGIIEGGRIFGAWLVITNEAREAARWGAVRGPDRATTTDVETQVRQRTTGVLDQAQLTPIATLSPSVSDPQWLTVRVNYNVELLAPFIFFPLPNPVPLTADSTMRTEAGSVGG